ncbi:MAG: ATP synthase F0 subunit B [Patescibacteria group bacterium]
MDVLAKIGIDWWGVLLYAINFGVLLLVLAKFLYKPLLKVVDERQKFIADNVSAAEQLRHDFEQEAVKQKAETAAQVARLEKEIAEAKLAANAKAEQLLADAEAHKAKLLQETAEQIEAMKQSVKHELEAEMLSTMKKVVVAVLSDHVPAEAVEASVRAVWKDTAKL